MKQKTAFKRLRHARSGAKIHKKKLSRKQKTEKEVSDMIKTEKKHSIMDKIRDFRIDIDFESDIKDFKMYFSAMFAVAIISTFFAPALVYGESMEPTLKNYSYTFFYKTQDCIKGDIVLISTEGLGIGRGTFVKRIVATEGDVVEIIKGDLVVNGNIIKEPYIKERMPEFNLNPEVVPEGHVYIMGDNRNNSFDSRHIGSFPEENIVGRLIRN